MKVLLDTNVILDFFLAREPHHEPAKKIFELTYKEKIAAYATASSVTDIYYIMAKRLGDDEARGVIRNLLSLLAIISVDGEDCAGALDLPIQDYEDAVISTCAAKEDMDFVLTNDIGFLQADQNIICVVIPSDFLNDVAAYGIL